MTQLTRTGRLLVTQTEAGVLRQNGATLTEEWHADADAYVDGTITLEQWRARNAARTTPLPECDGACVTGEDVGAPDWAQGYMVNVDPQCSLHGGEK